MKKSLILLALPALLLSGCSKEISKEDAKKRAQGIVDHEVTALEFQKVRIENVSEGSYEGSKTGSGKTTDVTEFSSEDKWIHTKTVSESKEGEEVNNYESERWIYESEGKYVIADYVKYGGEEQKTYQLFQESDALWAVEKPIFESAFATAQTSAFAALSGKEYLKMVISSLDGQDPEGTKLDVKYYSTGDGNLSIEGTVVYQDEEVLEGFKGDVTAKVKVGWDKYVLAEDTLEEEAVAKNAAGEEVKFKNVDKTTYSYEVTVTRPNLEEFTPAN